MNSIHTEFLRCLHILLAHELLYITFQQSSISLSLGIEVINYFLGTAVQKLSCGKLLSICEWSPTVNNISKLAVRVKLYWDTEIEHKYTRLCVVSVDRPA